jgi:2-C-methyl-D-erythritol 2,4-cyclodiphosphate synthase
MMRIGFGYDIHRLADGRRLMLGGIEIPYIKGLLGHSDADCLLHAICDSILGAIGAGDIGEHFPDTDSAYKDISSMDLLQETAKLLTRAGYKIENIDTTVIAQAPRLGPFKKKMTEAIAKGLSLPPKCVNIKATTAEGLGPLGREEAIACYAVVLITKI